MSNLSCTLTAQTMGPFLYACEQEMDRKWSTVHVIDIPVVEQGYFSYQWTIAE